MTDWKSLAATLLPEIPGEEITTIAQPLERLEEIFRPLTLRLPVEAEPEVSFRCRKEDYL